MHTVVTNMLHGLLSALILFCANSHAEIYNPPENFIQQQFAGEQQQRVVWLKGALKQQITQLLGEPYRKIRIRYWQQAERTGWILDMIGKDLPITAGFVVEQGQIRHAEVLVFREERGWEIRYPAFTRQFSGAALDGKQQLSAQVDGITGATMSVDAMKAMARLALFLDHYVHRQQA